MTTSFLPLHHQKRKRLRLLHRKSDFLVLFPCLVGSIPLLGELSWEKGRKMGVRRHERPRRNHEKEMTCLVSVQTLVSFPDSPPEGKGGSGYETRIAIQNWRRRGPRNEAITPLLVWV